MLSDSREYEVPWNLMAATALLIKESRALEASGQVARWYLDLAIKGVMTADLVITDSHEPSYGSRLRRFHLGRECARHAYSLPIDHLHRAIGLVGNDWGCYLLAGFVTTVIDRSLEVGWGPFDDLDFQWLMTHSIPSMDSSIRVNNHLTDPTGWFLQTSNSISTNAPVVVKTHYSAGGLFNKIWGTSGV